ncbi:MAG: hypothetical protein R3350_03210 [Saprospiraceae bacterium]|nr:hypothetical protein [Saprospiraceae bacterium]
MLLCLLCSFLFLRAGNDDSVALLGGKLVEVSSLRGDTIAVAPGRVTSVPIRFANLYEKDQTLRISIHLPDDISMVTPLNTIDLAPSGAKISILNFISSPRITAGLYSASLSISDEESGIKQLWSFQIRILEVDGLKMEALSGPDFAISGESLRATYAIQNTGNVEREILLYAHNCEVIGDEKIRLPARTRKIIEVKTVSALNVTKPSRQSLRLEAVIELDEGKRLDAHAYHHVLVYPSQHNEQILNYRHLPSFARLSMVARKGTGPDIHTGMQAEVYVAGDLDTANIHRVEVRMKGPNQSQLPGIGGNDEFFVRYEGKDIGSLWVGDMVARLSPLLEYTRYGRGFQAEYQINDHRTGLFYLAPRFTPALRHEMGLFLRKDLDDVNTLQLNVLQKVGVEGEGNHTLASLFGSFRPLPDTWVEAEAAMDFGQGKGKQAGFIKFFSEIVPNMKVGGQVLYAGSNFNGYYSDTWDYSGVVNYQLSPKLVTFAYFDQDGSNIVRDTLFDTAPLAKRITLGGEFRFSNKSRIRGSYHWKKIEDQLEQKKFHNLQRTVNIKWTFTGKKVQMSVAGGRGDFIDLMSPEAKPVVLTRGNFGLGLRLSSKYQLKADVEYFDLGGQQLEGEKRLIYSFSANARPLPKTSLNFSFQNAYRLDQYHRERDLMRLRIRQEVGNRHRIDLTGRYSLRRQSTMSGDMSAQMTYTYDFGIPLEKKSATGAIAGRIAGPDSMDLRGIVVIMNGQSAVTDNEGRFEFKRLAPGKYPLLIDRSSLGVNLITDQMMPMEVEILPEESVHVPIRLMKGAIVSGKINLTNEEKYSSLGAGEEDSEFGTAIIELEGEKGIYRNLSGPDGSFRFSRLRPGKWKLTVYHRELGKKYYMEDNGIVVDVDEGGGLDLHLEVKKKQRKIQFIDAGGIKLHKK